jgi:hypothetical protein
MAGTDFSITHTASSTLLGEELPRFIGKSGSGIKDNIIKPAWRLYNRYAKTNKLDSRSEKLRVLASFTETEGFTVKIECQTDPMLKFAMKSLTEYIKKFSEKNTPKTESPFYYIHFYTSEEHHRIAKFIGRGGQNIKDLTSSISSLISDSELERNDLSISVKPFHTESDNSLDYLKDKKFAFVNHDGIVSDSVVSEDGPYIFIVIRVRKSITLSENCLADVERPEDLYGLFEDTVVDYLKPQDSHNPEIDAEIEAALGGW